MSNSGPLVSIIIPVFNAEKTLTVCLESLKAQRYPFLEILFVNDCSIDSSAKLILDFAEKLRGNRDVAIRIFHHEENKGVAAARNTALDHAKGEYIYYVDADDTIESDTIAVAVETAIDQEADIVGFNWFLTFLHNEKKMSQPAFYSSLEAISLILKGKMRWNLWLFITKRKLYEENNIRFTPGNNMGEDLMVTLKLFSCAGNVTYINSAFYHYHQSNSQSLTKVYSDQHICEVTENVKEVEAFLSQGKFANDVGNLFIYLKLNIKLPLLMSQNTGDYERWLDWFPEANPYVLDNRFAPLHIRILQWMAVHRQYWVLRCYHRLIFRMVYGVLYK